MRTISFVLLAVLLSGSVWGQGGYTTVNMREKGSKTYYVEAHLDGYGSIDFMVDTGAGYVTINEETLAVLKQNDRVEYKQKLDGIMADGTRVTVPVYIVDRMTIGGVCTLRNVEVAVFPDDTRCILGMSALRKTAPFVFSVEPPHLQLSNCSPASM